MTLIRRTHPGKLFAISAFLWVAAAALPARAADDLTKVLARLDAEAASFKSAQADIIWENVQTQPISDDDKQVGTVLFERRNGQVQMALHIKSDNGRPIQKDLVYASGVGKLYEPMVKQEQVFKVGDKQSQLDAFLTLGFGGSGKDLQKSWDVSYLGAEQVDGVSTAKLQLVPRDAALAKTTPKVLLWIDMGKGVAVKQQRFNGDAGYVLFIYSNVRLNGSVPSGAFEIKTAPGTQIVNH